MKSYAYRSKSVSRCKQVGCVSTPPSGGGRSFAAKSRPTLLLLAATAFFAIGLAAQTPSPKINSTPATIPALLLSDIHLDPYNDPAKTAKLNAAPASDWPAILAAPNSPTQPAQSAALQQACPVRGIDTPNALWLSSLRAIHASAAAPAPPVQFVTVSGDLLAHAFDCKYKDLLPAATHTDYLAFTEKTIRYIVSSLRASLPGVPIYVALGNNDSGCTDYALDATHDQFLALTAKIVAEALPVNLPQPDRDAVLRDFSAGGYYNVPLAALPHTRLIVLDDLYLSPTYVTCAGKPDPAPAAAQLAWLDAQLSAARSHNERVWVMGHIPPGVNVYATARKFTNICAGGKPQMYLASEDLAAAIDAYADVVTLAIFGHSHSDELRLLQSDSNPNPNPKPGPTDPAIPLKPGVPVKIVGSITPVNGNNPTFTLASIDPATATLIDYTVIMASNQTGIDTTWAKEYTYSTTYQEPAFNSAALTHLIAEFQADPTAQSPLSQAYVNNYAPQSAVGQMLKLVWPQLTCSLNHDSAASLSACVCTAAK